VVVALDEAEAEEVAVVSRTLAEEELLKLRRYFLSLESSLRFSRSSSLIFIILMADGETTAAGSGEDVLVVVEVDVDVVREPFNVSELCRESDFSLSSSLVRVSAFSLKYSSKSSSSASSSSSSWFSPFSLLLVVLLLVSSLLSLLFDVCCCCCL